MIKTILWALGIIFVLFYILPHLFTLLLPVFTIIGIVVLVIFAIGFVVKLLHR